MPTLSKQTPLLQNPKNEASQDFAAASSRTVVLVPEQLVSSLNEHVSG